MTWSLFLQVVIVPGSLFAIPGSEGAKHSNFARLAFSTASVEELAEGAKRLGSVLRAVNASK